MNIVTGCSGIDAIAYIAELLDIELIGQIEIDEFCNKILELRYPGVKRYKNIYDVRGDEFGTVDIFAAGIPCQPFSHAGKRKGSEDDRYLWPEAIRIIRCMQPTWIIIENVDGILNTIHEEICIDLEAEGYEVETYNIPAITVGTPHERYRVFIVANSSSKSVTQTNQTISAIRKERNPWQNDMRTAWGTLPATYWGTHKPPVCGVDDGITNRLYKDRMKCLGNAVVPQQVYPILQAIADIETMTEIYTKE